MVDHRVPELALAPATAAARTAAGHCVSRLISAGSQGFTE